MKKILSIVLVVAMVLALAACGGKKDETTKKDDTATVESGTETGSGEAAATGGVFKIGGIGPITGAAALYGIAVKEGGQIAVDEINAAGGINGMQIEFNFQDDEHDAEKAVNAYNSVKDWGAKAVLGCVTSTPCIAAEAEAVNDNMFLITPSATAVPAISGDNAFRVCFADPAQGLKSAQYIGANLDVTKVAVLYDSSDTYSTGIYEEFVKETANQDFEIVATGAYTNQSNTDFTVQLKQAQEAGAELVFIPIYYQDAALILTQANKIGYAPQWFGCDGLDGLINVENFDTALAEGVMLLTPFAADATDDLTVNFVKKYSETYGSIPIQFAADAYDAIYAIKAAAEKANINSDMNISDTCDAMKVAMTEITLTGLTGTITWTADGEPDKEPKAVIIDGGAYVSLE